MYSYSFLKEWYFLTYIKNIRDDLVEIIFFLIYTLLVLNIPRLLNFPGSSLFSTLKVCCPDRTQSIDESMVQSGLNFMNKTLGINKKRRNKQTPCSFIFYIFWSKVVKLTKVDTVVQRPKNCNLKVIWCLSFRQWRRDSSTFRKKWSATGKIFSAPITFCKVENVSWKLLKDALFPKML